MIEKITFNPNKKVQNIFKNAKPAQVVNSSSALSPIFFKGGLDLNNYEGFIRDDEIRIPNLLELNESIDNNQSDEKDESIQNDINNNNN